MVIFLMFCSNEQNIFLVSQIFYYQNREKAAFQLLHAGCLKSTQELSVHTSIIMSVT